jgi:hypothetical protein
MKFLSDGAAANHFAALEHKRLEPAFRKIKRRDQCVVPTADDRDALSDGHN